jgi:biotin carboxyl carrier protein
MKYFIDYKNETIEVQAEYIKGKLWVHFEGQTICLESTDVSFKKSKNQGLSSNQIISPMPGKVIKILKNAGESVTKGDTVLVMEAMKMEYTLKSGCNGTIEKILTALNKQVSVGKVLALIKDDK